MSRTTWQRMVLITHVILESSKPFAEVQAALEALLPPLGEHVGTIILIAKIDRRPDAYRR
jgi:hypothetical protein